MKKKRVQLSWFCARLLVGVFFVWGMSGSWAHAMGITPGRVNLGVITSGQTKYGSVMLLRDRLYDGTDPFSGTVSARLDGSSFFSGLSSFSFSSDQDEMTYTFSIHPSENASGSYAIQVDFVVNRSHSVSAPVGAQVISGTTALVQFEVPVSTSVNPSSTPPEGGIPPSTPVVLPKKDIPQTEEFIIIKPVEEVPQVSIPETVLQQEIKEILPAEVVFSQPKELFPEQLVITHKDNEIDHVVFDPLLKKPVIYSDTHTAEDRYFKTQDVHLQFDAFPLEPKFDGFYYTISTSPVVYISELQSTSDGSEIEIDLPDGIYYVHVVGVKKGVLSAPHTRRLMIDFTPPVVEKKYIVTKERIFRKSKHALRMSLFDRTSGVAYGKIITPYGAEVFVTDQIPLRHLKNGNQIYQVALTDVAGNVSVEDVLIHVQRETEWETIQRLWRLTMQWIRK